MISNQKIGFRSLIIRCWPANIFCFEVLRITFYFRSFVPPVRDEESETQRKAHAKRVRETRRSTQGVTLEDLKSAEQLVKKKQQQENQQRTSELQQLVASQNKNSPTTVPSVSIQQPSSGKINERSEFSSFGKEFSKKSSKFLERRKKSWKFVYILAKQCRSHFDLRIFFWQNIKIRKILISRT